MDDKRYNETLSRYEANEKRTREWQFNREFMNSGQRNLLALLQEQQDLGRTMFEYMHSQRDNCLRAKQSESDRADVHLEDTQKMEARWHLAWIAVSDERDALLEKFDRVEELLNQWAKSKGEFPSEVETGVIVRICIELAEQELIDSLEEEA